jgi:3-oxoacyl-[acyl-carrier-protein] synthase II
MSQDRSVVVTGVGIVCAFGDDPAVVWSQLLAGSVSTRALSRFDTTALSVNDGAELPAGLVDAESSSLPAEWAARAAVSAVADAGLDRSCVDPTRAGVCFGSVLAARGAMDRWLLRQASDDPGPFARSWTSPSALSRLPARRLGFAGPNCVIATACAAGNSAISYATRALHADRADVMVAGGTEEISQTALMVFDALRALTPDRVRPFDRRRQGLLLGEGAAALVLERESDARARGATIHGRVLGHANVADGHHMTAPRPDGRGAARAMATALADAGVTPSDVDHVSAHGTGTPANDAAEALALREVFGPSLDSVPVTALKSMLGHSQGAASAIEAIACLWTMRDGAIPPTANVAEVDPSFELDLVTDAARHGRVDIAVSNAFGFGGNIECLVLGAP